MHVRHVKPLCFSAADVQEPPGTGITIRWKSSCEHIRSFFVVLLSFFHEKSSVVACGPPRMRE